MSDEDKEIQALKELIAASQNEAAQPWSAELVQRLGFGILIFSLLVIAISAWVLRSKDVDGYVILKTFGLTLIVCMSAFLMVTGYGRDQLTPVIGLFGAIVGYLLGREKRGNNSNGKPVGNESANK